MFKLLNLLILLSMPFSVLSAEKLVFTVECAWDDLDASSHNQKQVIKLYKDETSQRLEIVPTSKDAHKPVYFMKNKGSYTTIGKKEYFKEYFWQGSDVRLTLLRGNETLIKIESISEPSFPELTATCPKPAYNS